MSGWDKKSGSISKTEISEDELWEVFNYVFSFQSSKRNSYKFGFIKAILDNLLNVENVDGSYRLSYFDLFNKFTENYWNLVVKYNIRQIIKNRDGQNSVIENIFFKEVNANPILKELEFISVQEKERKKIISKVTYECKKYVIGALHEDTKGFLYEYDRENWDSIKINPVAYEFMFKYKSELEKLNYYEWAKFLEKANKDKILTGIIGKIELCYPAREDLSIYRGILYKEFGETNCFYCGKKLNNKIHVDHFIPWSFVKEDKIWNFVLACPECNIKKKDKLPLDMQLKLVVSRNIRLQLLQNEIVKKDFKNYDETILLRMKKYAKYSGYRMVT